MREIFLRIRRALHLHQADGKFICHKRILTRPFEPAGVLFCSSFLGEFVLSICARFNANHFFREMSAHFAAIVVAFDIQEMQCRSSPRKQ
jgi:hypothetical protein